MRSIVLSPSGWQKNSMCVLENKIWLFHERINALVCVDIVKDEVECVVSVDGEPYVKDNLFCAIVEYNNRLILIPYSASRIYIYDLNTGDFVDNNLESISGIRYVFKDKNWLYMFPMSADGFIVKLNMKDYSDHSRVRIEGGEIESRWLGTVGHMFENSIYLPIYRDNNSGGYIEYDMLTDKCKYFELNKGLDTLTIKNNKMYFTGIDDNVYKYDNKSLSVVHSKLGNGSMFLGTYDNKILLEAYDKSDIYSIENEKMVKEEHLLTKNKLNSSKVSSFFYDDSYYVMFNRADGYLAVYNKDNENILCSKYTIPVDSMKILKSEAINEGGCMNLQFLLDILQ